MNPIAAKALELFSKKFGRKILKSAADNKWVADMIKKLKASPKPGVLFKGKSKDYKGIESIKPENLNAANSSRFVESAKEGNFKGWTPRVIKGGKKADGGRIDKPLPTRSRDI